MDTLIEPIKAMKHPNVTFDNNSKIYSHLRDVFIFKLKCHVDSWTSPMVPTEVL